MSLTDINANVKNARPLPLGPVELVVLQGTSLCNLNCSYCYLSQASRRDKRALSLADTETIFANILTSSFVTDTLQVVWHSGEPLVLGPDYYRAAIDAILALAGRHGVDIGFDIQTNGTLIDHTWCDLFREYRDVLSVGVSCDGPAFLHDTHRKNWAGKPTHRDTCRGIDMLREHGIRFDMIAVVSETSLHYPREFLAFFDDYAADINHFHFNLLDELPVQVQLLAGHGSYAARYRAFLRVLLDAAGAEGAGATQLKIRNFSSFFERVFADAQTRAAQDARKMSHPFTTLNIDVLGNVSTCYAGLVEADCEDIYGDGRGLTIGNLLREPLGDIAKSGKLQSIIDDFEQSHRSCERECEFFSLCSGGYNLIKHKRFGTFDVAETPECAIHVKTFATTILEHVNTHARRV